jgi:LemA protein
MVSGIIGLVLCGIGVIAIGLIAWGIGLYNGLITLKNIVDEAWSGISVQLKRRYDLIPNLVETVKGYAKHEKGTLEKITELRSSAMQTTSIEEKGQIENQLTGALKSLFAVAESYPDLKANQNFLDLQKQLSEVEDNIQNARRYYNGTVRDFNTKIQVFPNSLIANFLNFKAREFFEATEEEQKNIKVDFSN